MKLSVILCTHNPRRDYLGRTLRALQQQTLPQSAWELLIIDNASEPPLRPTVDISWHSAGRHFFESELSLTQARMHGIRESQSELLVFVDDDNELQNDYLETASTLAERHPYLGAFGGSIVGEFEVEPDRRLNSLLESLALRRVSEPRWANHGTENVPFGAGLCIRRQVAEAFASKISGSDYQRNFGRRVGSLMGGDDLNLAMTSYDLGFGAGLFPELRLTHLIDKRRVMPNYLKRVAIGGNYGLHMVQYWRTGKVPRSTDRLGRLTARLKRMARTLLARPLNPIEVAIWEAERLAARDIKLLQTKQEVQLHRM